MLLLLSLVVGALGQTVVCESQLQAQVDSILAAAPVGALWGVSVSVNRNNTANSTWAQLLGQKNNELQYFAPASNTKLFATAVTYQKMGPSATFKTPVYLRNVVGQTASELCIGVVGDPSLNSTQLQNLVGAVQSAFKLTSIGKISIDTRIIYGPETPDDWEWGDLLYDYGAQPSAAVVDEQVVNVRVSASSAGSPATVTYLGPGDSTVFDIRNQATTVSGNTNTINCYYVPGSTALFVIGSIGTGTGSITCTVSVLSPDNHFARVMSSFFQSAGATTGSLAYGPNACSFDPFGNLPTDVIQVATITSPPFDSLINYTLLVSDNLYAELWLRNLGINFGSGSDTTLSQGLSVIKTATAQLGVTASYTQYDGSGLSRHNLISPLSLRQLLQGVWQQPWGKAYEGLLPVGGQTGTLANRFIGTPAYGKVHAKTGSMSGVSALSGYVDNNQYQQIVFSIVGNNCACSSSTMNSAVIDPIVVLLAQLAPC